MTGRPPAVVIPLPAGYSARTLSRACQDAVGRTAKQIIDERVTLDARRLLAHDERPVSAIARTRFR